MISIRSENAYIHTRLALLRGIRDFITSCCSVVGPELSVASGEALFQPNPDQQVDRQEAALPWV